MATMNISLPDKMREFVEQQVATGRYANSSDYVRDLIRYNQREADILRIKLMEGEASGESSLSFDEIIAEAENKFHD